MNMVLVRPSELEPNDWRQMQILERDQFMRVACYDKACANVLARVDDPEGYALRGRHPNRRLFDAGHRLKQIYIDPYAALSFGEGGIEAFGTRVGNISGYPHEIVGKLLQSRSVRSGRSDGPDRRYEKIEVVAADEDVAHKIGATLLEGLPDVAPLSVHAFPGEVERYEGWGFKGQAERPMPLGLPGVVTWMTAQVGDARSELLE